MTVEETIKNKQKTKAILNTYLWIASGYEKNFRNSKKKKKL